MVSRNIRLPKRSFAKIVCIAMMALGLLAGMTVPAFASNGTTNKPLWLDKKETLTKGHTDVFYSYVDSEDGKLKLGLEHGGAIYKPENIVLRVPKATFVDHITPAKIATSYYYLPQTAMQDRLFPGWDTGLARYAVGSEHADEVLSEIIVEKVQAPLNAKMLLWSDEKKTGSTKVEPKSFEKDDLDDTPEEGSRFTLPGIIHGNAGHVHSNWAFTRPGVYLVTAKLRVTNKQTKQTVLTDPVTYRFEVEDRYAEDDEPAVPQGMLETTTLTRREDYPELNENNSDNSENEANPEDSDPSKPMKITNIRNFGPHPHYHSYEEGGEIDLAVAHQPKDTTLEWRYIRADEPAGALGTLVSAQRLKLIPEPAMNAMKVIVEARSKENRLLVASAEATLAVDDHGVDKHPIVSVIAPYKRYKPGDKLKARAQILVPDVPTDAETGEPQGDPENPGTSIVKEYVWLLKKRGEQDFKQITKPSKERKLDLALDKTMDGATLRASLVLKNGTLYRNAAYDDVTDFVINFGAQGEQNPNPDNKQGNKKKSKRRHLNKKQRQALKKWNRWIRQHQMQNNGGGFNGWWDSLKKDQNSGVRTGDNHSGSTANVASQSTATNAVSNNGSSSRTLKGTTAMPSVLQSRAQSTRVVSPKHTININKKQQSRQGNKVNAAGSEESYDEDEVEKLSDSSTHWIIAAVSIVGILMTILTCIGVAMLRSSSVAVAV